jgi:hypothetical protein
MPDQVAEERPQILDEPRTEETQEKTPVVPPEAEEAETESGSGPEHEQEKRGKGGFSKRIDKLTARNYQLEKERQQFLDEIAEVKKLLAGKEAPAKSAPSEKPTPDKFNTYEDYVEALADWKSEQKVSKALEEREQETAKKVQDAQIKETFDSYNKRVSEFRGEHDDFDEVVGRDDISIPQSVQLAIVEMDNGPEVAYYLGQHPEEAEKLLNMSPLKSVMAIARISDSLTKESPEPRPVSRAAAPVKPVGSSSTRSSVSLEDLPQREYNRIRNEQEQKRRLGR